MKTYFKIIGYSQQILLIISIVMMMALPIALALKPTIFSLSIITALYTTSHVAVFFVMTIRPLADIFKESKWIRPLVILRKGIGVFSASIIISFILAKLIVAPTEYLSSFTTLSYWSMKDYAVLAHIADISAVLLIITSNSFSKRVLGSWWKRIQKLSYVYFYASALYVYLSYGTRTLLYAMIFVTLVTTLAYLQKRNITNMP